VPVRVTGAMAYDLVATVDTSAPVVVMDHASTERFERPE
jgi:hypothetical protein